MSGVARKVRRAKAAAVPAAAAPATPTKRGPLQAIGYRGSTKITGRVLVGPCEHVDATIVEIARDATQLLYGCVGALRTTDPHPNPKRHALQQILVASTAIAASEAEAVVTMFSTDLCAPGRIHARALGDLARRFRLLPLHLDAALEMYEALEVSRKQMVRKVDAEHPVRKIIDPMFENVDGKTMEAIERKAYEGDDQSESWFMDAYESTMLSKWNHADIVALAEAGDRLLAAGEDLRTAIVTTNDANVILHRAVGKMLVILDVLRQIFKFDIGADLDALIQRHAETATPFAKQAKEVRTALTRAARGDKT